VKGELRSDRLIRHALVAVAIAFMVMLLSASSAHAQPTPTPGPSSPTTTPTSPANPSASTGPSSIPGLNAATGAVGKIVDVVGGGVADSVIGSALGFVTDSLFDGIGRVIDEFSSFVDTTTNPDPTEASFLGADGPYAAVASFSAALLIGFICLGVAHGLFTGEPVAAIVRLLRDIPLAILAILAFPWLVGQLVGVSNGLSTTVLPTGETAKELLTVQFLENLRGIATGNLIPSLLMGLLTFAATLLLYLELIVRVVVLRLVEALAPLSLAPMVWPPARAAARKVAELTVAVILSEPAIFLALRIGLDYLRDHATSAPRGGAWGRLLLGLAVVTIATFSPWIIWRLLPHAEGMLVAQGLSHAPFRGAMTGLQTAYWVTALRSSAGRGSGRGKPSAGGGGSPGAGMGPPRGLPGPGRPGGGGAGGSGAGSAAGGAGGAAGGVAAAGVAAANVVRNRTTTSADQQTSSASPAGGHASTAGHPPSGNSGSARGGAAPGWSRRPPGRP
jgi:hypothetical protein